MRFAGTARSYARYRPPYPPALFDLLVDRFALDGGSRVLDVATGTGQLALPLAERVREVVALDVSAEMLAELRAAAPSNVQAVERPAEDVGPDLGSFALATVGRAFHWLRRDDVLARLHPLARGLAIVGDGNPSGPPFALVADLAASYLGDRRPRHSGETWAEVVRRSPFGSSEETTLEDERVWTLDDVVGWTFSLSWASPALLGDRRGAFEAELRRGLEALGGGPWRERARIDVVLAPAR